MEANEKTRASGPGMERSTMETRPEGGKMVRGVTKECAQGVPTRVLRWCGWMVAAGLILGLPSQLVASQVKIVRMQDQSAFLEGTLDGLSVDALGTLRLAARAERLTALDEPFVLSAAPMHDGWVVGTGNDGRVLEVSRKGDQRVLFATEEPEVFAVAVGADGTVYAGGSPDGSLYRYTDGESQVLAELGQTYIWQIEPLKNGDLLVATGTEGKLFRVTPSGEVETVWDSDDTHVRTILSRSDGSILAGTAGEGLIVEIAPSGAVRTLYDAPEPEVVALTQGEPGSAWAAVLASEASQLPAPSPSDEKPEDESSGTAVVVVEETGVHLVGSRPPGHKGPRSEILQIHANGSIEPIARLEEDTVFSMAWIEGRLWVGTGLEGHLYSLRQGQLVLENDVDERQIVGVLADQGGLPALATSNASALYRLIEGRERTGTYVSPVLDAGQMADFGSFHHLGEVPRDAELRFSFRTGSSAEPDGSWSSWSDSRVGKEIPLGDLPPARFAQWRMEATARGESPSLSSAEMSYRQQNLAPRVAKLEVWPPGRIRVPQAFNPSNQVFEPVHPNRDGIFTTLETSDSDNVQRYKELWKYGYRTLVWSAADPNQDELEYTLEVRREGASDRWLPLARRLEESHHSFDVTGVPDGVYRFRLTASDLPKNPHRGLEDQRQSEPVIIDHGGPIVSRTRSEDGTLRIDVHDDWNPLRRAEFSIDAGEWQPAPVADGLLDSRDETLLVPSNGQEALLVLRLVDAAFNQVTIDLGSAGR